MISNLTIKSAQSWTAVLPGMYADGPFMSVPAHLVDSQLCAPAWQAEPARLRDVRQAQEAQRGSVFAGIPVIAPTAHMTTKRGVPGSWTWRRPV
ncbi:hypothetical protein [Actinomadura craniellae]|uniref:hypothetical protein n=1 Tax=Actinomadura craniellae TaxID=2231787 RepID=UPI0011BEAF8D|nr:hypothetical protein [Actinomadura craniellae]